MSWLKKPEHPFLRKFSLQKFKYFTNHFNELLLSCNTIPVQPLMVNWWKFENWKLVKFKQKTKIIKQIFAMQSNEVWTVERVLCNITARDRVRGKFGGKSWEYITLGVYKSFHKIIWGHLAKCEKNFYFFLEIYSCYSN